MTDFRQLSPAEFGEVWRGREMAERNGWERTRLLAFMSLQPYMKSPKKPSDIMPLPWDAEAPAAKAAPAKTMTKEQHRQRIQQLLHNG